MLLLLEFTIGRAYFLGAGMNPALGEVRKRGDSYKTGINPW